MEPLYKQVFTVSDIHVDRFGRLKPSVVLYFAQEVAGTHAALLGAGWETLAQKHLFWAVIRNRVQITRLPVRGETVTVETWPMPTTRSAYPRSVIAYDEQGNELFRSISLWVLMDSQTRAMVLPGKSGIRVPGSLRGTELAPPGSIAPAPLANSTLRTVLYTELDRNGHMNNTRYLDWVADLLPSAFHQQHPMREFTVCYLSEAKENQHLQLFWELADGPCVRVDGCREKENDPGKTERVFSIRAIFM